MPGPMRRENINPRDKAKDFKGAIFRLFRELGEYIIVVIIALILAIYGARIGIKAPNILSNLSSPRHG